uniref:Pacifastin domain-containing protein n=1 Tax=Anopheles minimus TaxID=112268 RepID=A0A182WNK9_9DIPT
MKFSALLVGIMFLSFALCAPSAEEYRRVRRTMGAGDSFINCLAIGNSAQRICSYDLGLLEAIEQQQKNGSRTCPEGKVFYRRCNACKCGQDGAFDCSTDLCGEDFFHTNGLPRYW